MKEYKLKINGNDYNVAIDSVEANSATVEVNGTSYTVEFEQPISKPKKTVTVVQPARPTAAPAAVAPVAPVAAAPAGANVVTSPLPGVILNINVAVGATVKKGDTVMILEAMKMENAIEATSDGTVKSISVQKGDSVLEGAQLMVIG